MCAEGEKKGKNQGEGGGCRGREGGIDYFQERIVSQLHGSIQSLFCGSYTKQC